jgi:queuine tRNA-ribosyltransferase
VAQRGAVFTSRGYLQMRRGVYKFAEEKLDPECSCPTCGRYSRAYLHHLTKSGETLGWQLLGKHNIHFYHQLMREIRAAILADRFLELYRSKREFLHEVDADNPILKQRPNKKRSLSLGAYEVHIAREGFASMRHRSSGEIMHSRTAPMEEAQRLYVEQSELAERLRHSSEPLVIWDVGLGAGANAMAAIHCYEKQAATGPVRPLQLISFENDLDSLKLALRLTDLFPYLRHGGPPAILKEGRWQSKQHPGLSWSLVVGDFLETMKAAPARPDLIYYDMFSSKTCGDQWTLNAFAQLFSICRGRAIELFTYTCSTSARVALLAAGFHVARGRSAGEKEETTIALTPEAAAERCKNGCDLLSSQWLEKWDRSGAKFPPELPAQERTPFERMIRAHEQFQPRR